MNDIAIITGASSGIGFELAKILDNEDIELLLISRTMNNIESFKNAKFLSMDLSEEIDFDLIKKEIKGKNLKYLINNAGFGDYGFFSEIDINKNEKMIKLNILTLTKFSKFFLDINKNNPKKSYLLNVASVAAFMPGPLMSVYYATKAYVLSFSRAIRFENSNKNIVISCLCPGPTSTNFIKSSNLENSNIFNKLKAMTANDVAKIAHKQLIKEKELIIPGLGNKIMLFLNKFAPSKLTLYFTKWINMKK